MTPIIAHPLRLGDEIYVRWDGALISEKIRWFCQARGELPCLASHVAKVRTAGTEIEEADWPRIHRHELNAWLTSLSEQGAEWGAYRRPTLLSPAQEVAMTAWLNDIDGTVYGVGEIVFQIPDQLIGKLFGLDFPPVIFRRLGDILPNTTCAGLAASADHVAGLLPHRATYFSPDELLDVRTANKPGRRPRDGYPPGATCWECVAHSHGWYIKRPRRPKRKDARP